MKLLVLFGGASSEHEVSCLSVASILRNIDRDKYDLYVIGITKKGEWKLLNEIDEDKIERCEWDNNELVNAVIIPDKVSKSIAVFNKEKTDLIKIDCCFPVLHGSGGEDGTIQGLLELAGIPYVGCGVAASANTMDKSITKIVVDTTSVRQAAYALAIKHEYQKDKQQVMKKAMEKLKNFPVFIKPCSSGSSVGVHKAVDMQSLEQGLDEAFNWDNKVLIEEFIKGREVEVAVMGNLEPVASIAGEIAPTQEFYTYDAKYKDDSSALYIPARISDKAMKELRENAVIVYTYMGCRGLSRVDFFCTDTEEIIFNEINTIPGFTSISMYPKLFGYGGIAYSELIDKLISLALEEHNG